MCVCVCVCVWVCVGGKWADSESAGVPRPRPKTLLAHYCLEDDSLRPCKPPDHLHLYTLAYVWIYIRTH